jgi:hypothetical protein
MRNEEQDVDEEGQ